MRNEYLHTSKYGNGVKVAEEFKKQMAANDVAVDIHHIRQARPDRLPAADVYVTSLKGPLEDGWEQKVATFAARVLLKV